MRALLESALQEAGLADRVSELQEREFTFQFANGDNETKWLLIRTR
jgi:hypothetical protein